MENLFGNAFKDARYKNELSKELNQECIIAVLDNLNKGLRVQETFNLEQRTFDCTLEMAEVQNFIRHRNKCVPSLSIQDQFMYNHFGPDF